MSEIKIAAEPRTEFGKGAARRIRREDKVPAVVYGHGNDPIHVTLPGHELHDGAQARRTCCSSWTSTARPSSRSPRRSSATRSRAPRAHRLPRGQARREGHRRDPGPHRGRAGPGRQPARARAELAAGRGRGHPHPRVRHRLHRGPGGRASILAKDIPLPTGTTLAVDEDAVVLQVLAAQAEEPTAEAEGAEAAEA